MLVNNQYKVNKKDFIRIVKESASMRQALLAMKLSPQGSNYDVLKRRCKELGIRCPERMQGKIRNSITNEQLVAACHASFSRQGCLKQLGLKIIGSNIRWIKRQILRLEISTSHWTGQGHLKGKTHNWSKKLPLSQILIKDSSYTNSSHLKMRLLREAIICNDWY